MSHHPKDNNQSSSEAKNLKARRYGMLVFTPDGDMGWLAEFDPDGGPVEVDYPTGTVVISPDPYDAIKFSSHAEAAELWKTQSKRTPFRPDGKPNRPLTAYSVSIRELP